MNASSTPPSFQPNDAPPPDSSSLTSISPHQHALSTQRVNQNNLIQPYATTHPTQTHYGVPSKEQHEAVSILRGIPDPTILFWLEGFRSCLRGEEWFYPGHLSLEQRQAARTLTDCPDEFVLKWLNLQRAPEVLSGSQSFHGNNSFSNDTVAANSLGQSSSSLGVPSSLRSTPKSTWDQEPYNISRDTSVGEESSPAASVDGHVHWCFKCDDPKPIIQCNGFKRHMREHETGFYCMLLGPVVQTEDGPKCAFCDASNPDSEHLSTHNIEPCASKPLTSRSYVRGYLLNNHLRAKHGIRDGSVLVNQWRSTVDRKYFACGFCGFCFGSLTEQLNHIDVAHYSISKEVYDWNSNMAIQGLLSQPGVNDRLQSILTKYPRLQESYLEWIPALAKDIQQILEMRELSEETADVLFPAVIDQIKYGRSGSAFAGPKIDSSQSMQTLQRQNPWPPLPSSSNQDSTHGHALSTTMPILQSQQLALESNDLGHTNWGAIYGTTHHLSGHAAQTRFSSNGCDSFGQQQHLAYVPSIASAQVWGDQIGTSHLSRLDERSQGVSPNVAVNPRPREVAEAREYSAQAYERGFHSSLTTRTAPLSHNRPISPMDQSNSSFGPADHPILAVRPPGKELMDQYGVDNKQHTRQNQKRTRRQRRPC